MLKAFTLGEEQTAGPAARPTLPPFIPKKEILPHWAGREAGAAAIAILFVIDPGEGVGALTRARSRVVQGLTPDRRGALEVGALVGLAFPLVPQPFPSRSLRQPRGISPASHLLLSVNHNWPVHITGGTAAVARQWSLPTGLTSEPGQEGPDASPMLNIHEFPVVQGVGRFRERKLIRRVWEDCCKMGSVESGKGDLERRYADTGQGTSCSSARWQGLGLQSLHLTSSDSGAADAGQWCGDRLDSTAQEVQSSRLPQLGTW